MEKRPRLSPNKMIAFWTEDGRCFEGWPLVEVARVLQVHRKTLWLWRLNEEIPEALSDGPREVLYTRHQVHLLKLYKRAKGKYYLNPLDMKLKAVMTRTRNRLHKEWNHAD